MNFDLSTALASVTPGRPLVITDADGVLLCFADGLDRWLRDQGLYLDLARYYGLRGNIRRLDDHETVLDVEAFALVDEFRRDLDHLEAVDGACEALAELAKAASIVVLSNVTESQAVARQRNFAALGLTYPLVANDGGGGFLAGKGAAVRALATRAGAKTFFIDDIPANLASVAQDAPDVTLIHLVESAALRKLLGQSFPAHCHAETWQEAKEFIFDQLR